MKHGFADKQHDNNINLPCYHLIVQTIIRLKNLTQLNYITKISLRVPFRFRDNGHLKFIQHY